VIIFVAGIHGVGKTYLSVPIARQTGIRHATASQLIREERGMQSWGQDKRVSEVDDNQAALISSVGRIIVSGQTLLLDGHFVLRGGNGSDITIPEAVFRDLRVDAVLLVEGDVEVISRRLTARGDYSWNLDELVSLAIKEAAHALSITSALGIPLRVMKNPDLECFKNAVQEILG
jgi:adenylate kinase